MQGLVAEGRWGKNYGVGGKVVSLNIEVSFV